MVPQRTPVTNFMIIGCTSLNLKKKKHSIFIMTFTFDHFDLPKTSRGLPEP